MLTSAMLGVQVAGIIATPILSRLFTPAEFGAAGVVTSIAMIVAAGAALRFDVAVPLPRDDDDAFQLLGVATLATFITTALTAAVLAWQPDAIVGWLAAPEARPLLWTVPVLVLGASLKDAWTNWPVRTKEFGLVARVTVVPTVVGLLTRVVAGVAAAGPLGLVAGALVSAAGGALRLVHATRSALPAGARFRADRMAAVARQYWRFAVFSAPGAWINALSVLAPPILLVRAYELEVAGWYGVASRLLDVGMAALGGAVGRVFFAELAEALRDDPARVPIELRWITLRLAALAVPVIVAGVLLGPWAFRTFLGANWGEAGWYARWLVVAAGARLVAGSTSNLNTFGWNRAQLMWDGFRAALIVGVLVLVPQLGFAPRDCIAAYALAMTVAYAVLLLLNFAAAHSIARTDAC